MNLALFFPTLGNVLGCSSEASQQHLNLTSLARPVQLLGVDRSNLTLNIFCSIQWAFIPTSRLQDKKKFIKNKYKGWSSQVSCLICIVLYYYTAIKVYQYQISLKKKHDVGAIGRNTPINANHQNNTSQTNGYLSPFQ